MTKSIERARAAISNARNVLALTGAGISAESGVPTFRGGGGAGVWRGMPFSTLSSARMVRDDLPLVWEWFDHRRSVLADCKPNPGHLALANAQASGRFDSFIVVTQNIDDLHSEAGCSGVVELHGNIHEALCSACGNVSSLSVISLEMRPPLCSSCGGPMRPNVVLFGEMLFEETIEAAQKAAESCDVCIVIGTSALVSPANQLPLVARNNGAVMIEVNPEDTALSGTVDISVREYSATALVSMFELVSTKEK